MSYESPQGNSVGYIAKDSGLFALLRVYGCPMMDDTPWDQSQCGEFFTSPVGTGTAAFWLPCVSPMVPPVIPGTCDACVASAALARQIEPPLFDARPYHVPPKT